MHQALKDKIDKHVDPSSDTFCWGYFLLMSVSFQFIYDTTNRNYYTGALTPCVS